MAKKPTENTSSAGSAEKPEPRKKTRAPAAQTLVVIVGPAVPPTFTRPERGITIAIGEAGGIPGLRAPFWLIGDPDEITRALMRADPGSDADEIWPETVLVPRASILDAAIRIFPQLRAHEPALGLLESPGLPGAICYARDTLKAAQVELHGCAGLLDPEPVNQAEILERAGKALGIEITEIEG